MNHRTLCTIALLSLVAVATAEARARTPIHTVVGTVESVSTLDAPGDVTLIVRQQVSPTPLTIVMRRPEVPAEYRGIVQGLMNHGPSPRAGDVVRATGWLVMGQPLVASVVEVRDGPACTGRCIQFVDGARGYRLWLHRSFIDVTQADSNETALWVAMSQVLAQHDKLESSRTAVWLAGPADRLFGYYTNPRQVDGYISTQGTSDLREPIPRLTRLATELGAKKVLILGLPFMPVDWSRVFVGNLWMYFPLQIYVANESLRRVF